MKGGAVMLSELCAELRNYFCRDAKDKHIGEFTISGGTIAPSDFLQDGQYFAIFGSTFNDGVHQYPAADLTDETFEGSVWAMSVPPDFIQLSADVENYVENDEGKPSPFTSESFGGYSYSKATDNGAPITWQKVFAKRMNKYRRMRP